MSSLVPLRRLQPVVTSFTSAMSTNASGLKPEESKILKERSAQTYEQPVIAALKEVEVHTIITPRVLTARL